MKIEFDSDNDRLGNILYALANSSVNPEFSIGYTVKDKEGPKAELISRAIEDARRKADIIASSADLELKVIESIDFGSDDLRFEVSPVRMMYASNESDSRKSFDVNINPDDIELTENITIVWSIE